MKTHVVGKCKTMLITLPRFTPIIQEHVVQGISEKLDSTKNILVRKEDEGEASGERSGG
jgi:hypothetical protein